MLCKCGHGYSIHDHGWRQERCNVRKCDCPKFRRSILRGLFRV